MIRRNQVAIAVSNALVLYASAASAQDEAEVRVLEEIIVTATKREAAIQDIPFNISAFNESQLGESNTFEIARLAHQVPGLNVVDYGNNNTRDIILRGLNATRLEEYGNSGTTAVYLNDTFIDYTNLDMIDLSRVEVLRGPQGTLYGAGSVGGTIRYVTNAPDPNEFSGWAETGLAQTANADGQSLEARSVLNMPLVEDSLALRVYAGYREVPGFITKVGYPDRPALTPISREGQDDYDRFNARAALRWIMNDNVEATAAYTMQRLSTKGHGGATPGLGDAFTGRGGVEGLNDFLDENLDLYSLDVSANLGFATLTSNTAYREINHDSVLDGLMFLLPISVEFGLYYDLFPEWTVINEFVSNREQLTQEFRLASNDADSRIDYVAGLFYTDIEGGSTTDEFTPGLPDWYFDFAFAGAFPNPRPDDVEFLLYIENATREWAAFGEVTFNVTDSWDITLGGRYFDWEFEGQREQAFPILEALLGGFGTPDCAIDAPGTHPSNLPCTYELLLLNNDVDESVWKFNTSYQLQQNDALVFLTVAEGFRPGGANAFSAVVPVDSKFFGYDPDTATNYEFGVKSTLLNSRLRLNASVYQIDWEGIQLMTRIGGGFGATINGDDARISGIEMESTALLSDNWQFDFSFALLDAALTKDTVSTPEIDGQKGDRLPGSAETQVHAALRYETTLDNGMNVVGRLGGSYSGDVTSTLNDNFFNALIGDGMTDLSPNRFFNRLPSYQIWNLSLDFSRDDWSIYAYIDNLLDEEYIVATNIYATGAVVDDNYRWNYYGRPRTYGFRVRYNF